MLNELIPTSTEDTRPEPVPRTGNSSLQITAKELEIVVKNQKNRAPGAGGLTARIIKAA